LNKREIRKKIATERDERLFKSLGREGRVQFEGEKKRRKIRGGRPHRTVQRKQSRVLRPIYCRVP